MVESVDLQVQGAELYARFVALVPAMMFLVLIISVFALSVSFIRQRLPRVVTKTVAVKAYQNRRYVEKTLGLFKPRYYVELRYDGVSGSIESKELYDSFVEGITMDAFVVEGRNILKHISLRNEL